MASLEDVRRAQANIHDIVHKTPVLTSSLLDEYCGNQVFLKAEHLQKTGSFKIRGAANAVKNAVREGAASVTAASSGNHGQAVAYIANRLGIPATIVVPEDANRAKVAAIEAYNGHVVYCGMTLQNGYRKPGNWRMKTMAFTFRLMTTQTSSRDREPSGSNCSSKSRSLIWCSFRSAEAD